MASIDIGSLSVLTLLADDDLGPVQDALDAASFQVFTLDGASVGDEASFFAAALAGLPVPAGAQADGFDALRDHIRVGLAEIEATDVAFVWRHADAMLAGGLATLIDAVECFVSLSRQVNSPAATNFPRRIRLLTFLTGTGPNFPSLLA
ncbi:MAG TPA: hypothetical protein VGM78_15610 [Ilumatobacteraceae bacterium]|jgi:hypothetical protein